MTEAEYRRRLAIEKAAARRFLNNQLDGWCESYGWDPSVVWRRPRARERRAAQFDPLQRAVERFSTVMAAFRRATRPPT